LLTQSLAMKDEPKATPAGRPPTTAADRPEGVTPARMTVAGRVLDPAGKPVAGASVDIIGRPRRPLLDADVVMDRLVLLGRGTTDDEGRFRLDAARTSSGGYFAAYALAAAPGFGLGWVELNADSARPAAELRLRPEQVIRGKLVDISGRPASGV